MSHLQLQQIYRSKGISILDTIALSCNASSGSAVPIAKAKTLDEIIDVSVLPKEFLDPAFKQFRVATKIVTDKKKILKISIDPNTGEVLSGKKNGERSTWNLHSIDDLRAFGSMANAEYLQFIPQGTSYSVLDFDSDKTKSDEFRAQQVEYIRSKTLKQFDGIVELSASGFGLHAYMKDKNLDNLPADPYAVDVSGNNIGHLSFEIFTGENPIVLTGNIVDEAITRDKVGTLPKNIMALVSERRDKEKSPKSISADTATPTTATSTEEEVYPELIAEEADAVTEIFKSMDNDDRINLGYNGHNDPSEVDFAVASILLRASYGNMIHAHNVLHSWMIRWRPDSVRPLSAKEIANKSKRAIDSAYKLIEKKDPVLIDQWKKQAQEKKKGIKPHPFTRASDIKMSSPEWIIKGFVQKRETSMKFGPPEAGKSLILLDMAVAVSNGTPWYGNRTKKLTVLYLAGEGSQGIRRRLRAIEIATGANIDNIFISDRPGALIDEMSAKEIAEAIKGAGGDVWLQVDTLHRNIGDGDEDSSKDFGKMMKNIDEHILPLGATVSFVHHPGHSNTGRSRGSSSIRGSMDSEFQITKDQDVITMSCTKMKDAAHPKSVKFKLKVVDLGITDEDNEPVTSVCLEPGETAIEIMMKDSGLPLGSTLALQFYRENDENKALINTKSSRTHGAFLEWLKTSECPAYFEGKADTSRTLRRDIARLEDNGLISRKALSTGEEEPIEGGEQNE